MKGLSFYLDKYKDIGLKERQIEESLVKSIKDICNIEINKEDVKIRQNSINLNIKGIEKNEIFILKNEIEDKFQEYLNELGYRLDEKKIF